MFESFLQKLKRFLYYDDMNVIGDSKAEHRALSLYERPINADIHSPGSTTDIRSMDPRNYSECTKTVNDYLKSNTAVIINLHRLAPDVCKEAVAYLNGAVYALDGSIEKISDTVWLISPASIPVCSSTEETHSSR